MEHTHGGHRARMREKAEKQGFDGFHEHEILEMMLYSTIPQKDTNELAHILINRFGGFSNVFDASYDELRAVNGVGDKTAFQLKLISVSMAKYLQSKFADKPVLKSRKDVFDFLLPRYINQNLEMASVILMGSGCKVINWLKLSQGSVGSVMIEPRQVIEACVNCKATQIILCHNHPSGIAAASKDDEIVTERIKSAADTMNIKLVDHFILCDNSYLSMASLPQYQHLFM